LAFLFLLINRGFRSQPPNFHSVLSKLPKASASLQRKCNFLSCRHHISWILYIFAKIFIKPSQAAAACF